jgi:ABC-2 type transport system ATP-binding protein
MAARFMRQAGPVEQAIRTEGLTRSFTSGVALDGLTIEAAPGEVLALLGPNGAGKTTTVRLLDGVLQPQAGSARVLGLDPAVDGDEVRRRTGVLTENAGLDDRLTAAENLATTARIRGFGRAEAARRSRQLLERFAMGPRADDLVQGMSTGERKRIALARALLHDPDVLYLDEPTSGLDPSATRDVVGLIGELAAEHGRTVILCTHFLGEAGRLAHRVAVLDRGRLRAFGAPAELAGALLPGLRADVELPAPADERVVGAVALVPGVRSATPVAWGLHLDVDDRAVLAEVVATLVAREVPVYAAVPRPPSLEDVYFEVQRRIAAEPDWTMA